MDILTSHHFSDYLMRFVNLSVEISRSKGSYHGFMLLSLKSPCHRFPSEKTLGTKEVGQVAENPNEIYWPSCTFMTALLVQY